MAGIDPSRLPQTIRDAIRVTQALGILLLWTDSLCIIQDSPEDKHRELAYMLDVYRCAYLTIHAASAACASEGFLHNQRPLDTQAVLPFICPPGCAAPSAGSSEVLGNVYLLPCPSALRQTSDVETDSEALAYASQTGHRAWCLQETLVSTRLLVFSSETLQLRCQSMTQNVGGAHHRTSDWDLTRLPFTIFSTVRAAPRGSDEWRATRQTWDNVVRDYSRRLLSHPSDKLAACAGLAEMFSHALGATYVAGLWRDTLLVDLFWQSCDDGAGRLPPTSYRHHGEYRAPSWSWASFEGEVLPRVPSLSDFTLHNGSPELHAMAELVNCSVTPLDEKVPFGAVTRGSLTLRTWLLKVRSIWGSHVHRSSLVQYLVPAQTAQDAADSDHNRRQSDGSAASAFRLWSRLDSDEDDLVQDLWIIPVWRLCEGDGGILGLVLGEAESDAVRQTAPGAVAERVYRRVGHWAVHPPGGKDERAHLLELEQMFKANQAVNIRIV
ncbi:hypothetical protein GY45DRAFT_1319776 [Cubamyces sp. BRFM 1775]|nr:hypothetical protein GY45DRAFT_1319776 [Cubamyces sp. BRFM 1775]